MSQRPNNRPTLERRHFIAGVAGTLALPLAHGQSAPSSATPPQSLGPFYPRAAHERPRDTDADLLRVEGDRVLTAGVPIYLTGRVVTRDGAAVANAAVEIWQCDANSVYHHPAGGAESERDRNFQGYGAALTDGSGAFHFRTIRPVAYPGRTPHIHVRVQPQGGRAFATQWYLPGEAGNRSDFLFARLSADEQKALTLRLSATAADARHPLARATRQTASADLVLA